MVRQFKKRGEEQKLFNAMIIYVTATSYLTVLEKNRTKKIYTTMQHFLRPWFRKNILKTKRDILAYRFSKLACEGGSVYDGRTVHTTSTKISKPGKIKKTTQCQSIAVDARVTRVNANGLQRQTHLKHLPKSKGAIAWNNTSNELWITAWTQRVYKTAMKLVAKR